MSYLLFSCFWFSFSISQSSSFFILLCVSRRGWLGPFSCEPVCTFFRYGWRQVRTGERTRDSIYIFIASFVYFKIIFSLVMQAVFRQAECLSFSLHIYMYVLHVDKCTVSLCWRFLLRCCIILCVFLIKRIMRIVFTMNFSLNLVFLRAMIKLLHDW